MSFLVNREVDEGYFRKTNAWSGRITVSSTLMGGRAVDSPEIASIPSVLRHEATNLGCKHSAQIDFSAKNKKKSEHPRTRIIFIWKKNQNRASGKGQKRGKKLPLKKRKLAEQNKTRMKK